MIISVFIIFCFKDFDINVGMVLKIILLKKNNRNLKTIKFSNYVPKIKNTEFQVLMAFPFPPTGFKKTNIFLFLLIN